MTSRVGAWRRGHRRQARQIDRLQSRVREISRSKSIVARSGAAAARWFDGTESPDAGLGRTGDYYLNTGNGDVSEKTASGWLLVGNIAGPDGPAGADGPPGPPGTPGELWSTGAGAPASAAGSVGDWYLDSSSGDYHEKTDATIWTLRGNLRGPTGAAVATYSATPPPSPALGELWVDSSASPGPLQAAQILQGTTTPAGTLGLVGDWYINTATWDMYEKTGPTTWQLRLNIRGAAGTQGIQGEQGIQGLQGSPGTPGEKWYSGAGAPSGSLSGSVVGDWYLDTTSGDVHEKTGASTWTLRGNIKGPAGTTYTPPAWAAYTPTWTAPTNPSLGNGSIIGRYQQQGNTVHFMIVLTIGSTTTLGSGAYQLSLPVTAAHSDRILAPGFQTGPNQPMMGRGASTTAIFGYLTTNGTVFNHTNSGLVNGSVARFTGTYEAA